MQVVDQVDDKHPSQQAIYMSDVYRFLVGKKVRVSITGSHTIDGKLEACNGYILQIVDKDRTTYLSVQNVAAISEE